MVWLFLVGTTGAWGQLPALYQPATLTDAAQYAHRVFDDSRQRWLCQTNNAEVACEFGHACFEWAEYVETAAQHAAIAREGIAACRCALQIQSQLAAAHYYLGMNMGRLAETKPLSVLKIVRDMETEFKSAAALDPTLDAAGPWRSLGELYLDAPGFPFSIGNRARARDCFNHAVALRPDFPGNQLGLLEACLKLGDKKTVKLRFEEVERVLYEAHTQWAGVEWTRLWRDWNDRWDKLKRRAGVVASEK